MSRLTLAELKERARERIANGLLPRSPGKVFAGFGGPDPCALCDRPIDKAEVVYEFKIDTRGALRTIHFHPRCERIYHAARLSAADPSPP
jgi:hypothetical protein